MICAGFDLVAGWMASCRIVDLYALIWSVTFCPVLFTEQYRSYRHPIMVAAIYSDLSRREPVPGFRCCDGHG